MLSIKALLVEDNKVKFETPVIALLILDPKVLNKSKLGTPLLASLSKFSNISPPYEVNFLISKGFIPESN
ncbi:hypothetical protein LKM2_3160 [Leptospira kirschneri serovar Mozdok]|nr:hypothetical protein [Leptospira kirschneri serovar Mozdok]